MHTTIPCTFHLCTLLLKLPCPPNLQDKSKESLFFLSAPLILLLKTCVAPRVAHTLKKKKKKKVECPLGYSLALKSNDDGDNSCWHRLGQVRNIHEGPYREHHFYVNDINLWIWIITERWYGINSEFSKAEYKLRVKLSVIVVVTMTNINDQSDCNIAHCHLFYLFLFMTLHHLRSSCSFHFHAYIMSQLPTCCFN